MVATTNQSNSIHKKPSTSNSKTLTAPRGVWDCRALPCSYLYIIPIGEGRKLKAQFSGELVESVGGRRLGAGTRQRSCTEYGRLERPPARHMRSRLAISKRRDLRAVRASLLRERGPSSSATATQTRCVLFLESLATLGSSRR